MSFLLSHHRMSAMVAASRLRIGGTANGATAFLVHSVTKDQLKGESTEVINRVPLTTDLPFSGKPRRNGTAILTLQNQLDLVPMADPLSRAKSMGIRSPYGLHVDAFHNSLPRTVKDPLGQSQKMKHNECQS